MRQAEKLLHPNLMQSNFSRMALNQVMANKVLYPRNRITEIIFFLLN